MNYGELFKKTRVEANITQEEMAEKFQCDRSVISKIENDFRDVKATRMIEWLAITNRIDIFILLVKGMHPEEIIKVAFTQEYLDKISNIKFPTLDEIEDNFRNADKILGVLH
jgi:transcriptional regulator with XRE-family HTH domain